jgi:hypothetical protein
MGIDSVNEQAALECLATESAELKALTYDRLTALVDEPRSKWVTGPDGRKYQLEIQVFWEFKGSKNLRVMLSADDGGWRAFLPVTDSFIVSPS